MNTPPMSTRQHSREAYLLAFHTLYCLKRSPIEAGKSAGIHPAVIERAATGYMNSNGGTLLIGVADDAGDRELPIIDPIAARIAELEKTIAELKEARGSNSVPRVTDDSHAPG